MLRGKILDEAKQVINGERQDDYGAPEDAHGLIAEYWSVYLRRAFAHRGRFELTARDAMHMMTLFKLAREQHKHKADNYRDLCGYAALAADEAEREQSPTMGQDPAEVIPAAKDMPRAGAIFGSDCVQAKNHVRTCPGEDDAARAKYAPCARSAQMTREELEKALAQMRKDSAQKLADIGGEKAVCDPVQDLADMLGGKIEDRTPYGATMSMPLPVGHWLTRPGDNVPPMRLRMGKGKVRDLWAGIIRESVQYGLRCATMNGEMDDMDPDALVQNVLVGLFGYWTYDALSSDDSENPKELPPLWSAAACALPLSAASLESERKMLLDARKAIGCPRVPKPANANVPQDDGVQRNRLF